MNNIKTCPYCNAPYPECGEDCYNYKMAELVAYTFKQRGGRRVENAELEAAWNTRATEDALRAQLAGAVALLETSHHMVDTDEHRAAVDAFLDRVKGV